MKKVCEICQRRVDLVLFEYHQKTEEHLLEKIYQQYPAWRSNKAKALFYYRTYILGELLNG